MRCESRQREHSTSNTQHPTFDGGRRGVGRWMLNVERWMLGCLFPLALQACASPPSLLPLLRVADKAIAQESQLLDADAARSTAWLDEQRATLAAAFEADLREQTTLDPEWVLTATQAY